jgi:hypothetical protein
MIPDRQDQLTALHQEFIRPPQATVPAAPRAPLTLSDQEIVTTAGRARNGAKFERLYAGDLGDYAGDASAADLALCSLLSFYTDDRAQIGRIVAQSGLYRPKWDRDDYRERTIERALQRSETYSPPVTRATPQPIAASSDPMPDERPHAREHIGSTPDNPMDGEQPHGRTAADLTACQDAVAELRRENAELRAQLAAKDAHIKELIAGHSAIMRAIANPDLKRAALTGVVVANYIEQVRRDTDLGPIDPTKPPAKTASPTGEVALYLPEFAPLAGCKEEAVSAHLKVLAAAIPSIAVRRSRAFRPEHVDPQTGEILPAGWMSSVHVALKGEHRTVLDAIADYRAPEGTPKHGGKRTPRTLECTTHPDADQLVSEVVRCAECREILRETPLDTIPAPDTSLNRDLAGLEDDAPTVEVSVFKNGILPVLPEDEVVEQLRERMTSRETRREERGFRAYTPDIPTIPSAQASGFCGVCRRPLRNDDERRSGCHSYDCLEGMLPTPSQAQPPAYAALGGNADD